VDCLEGSRVYFSPCGIGFGHVSRSVSIAEEVARRGGEVVFSTYLEAVDYVRKYGFPVLSAPPIQMENDPTGSIDLKSSTVEQGITAFPTLLEQVKFEIQGMKAFDADVVFSDSRVSSIIAARLLKIPVVLLLNQFLPRAPRVKDTNLFRVLDGTVLTVLGRTWALSDIIVIPDFPEPYTISLDSLRIPRRVGARVKLVGSILQEKPEENTNSHEIRERLGVGEDQHLVYAGISGPRAEREPLVRLLEPIFARFPDRYRVLMSVGVPNGGSDPIKKGALTTIPWLENRFEFLNACDLVICRGGHETIMQSICYGKPSIIIPVPRHPEQYGNARRAMELGVATAIHQRGIDRDSLVAMVDKMVGSREYKRVLDDINSKEHLGDGLENTLEVIRETLHR
jgi:UDP-N-acetylglucosamine--N-acetylmuramyl-(pentapeptide) pyrophosphoryl-undecaprenol N-acetylglucosamine transferase